MSRLLVTSTSSADRIAAAVAWTAGLPRGDEVDVVGAGQHGPAETIRAVAARRGAVFGMYRLTLDRLAAELAAPALAAAGLATAAGLAMEALCARVIQSMADAHALGRFEAVAGQPGLARALARTLGELRMAGVTAVPSAPELDRALAALRDELAAARLADRTAVYALATAAARRPPRHLVLLDVAVRSVAERDLLAALVAGAPSAMATVPAGDDRALTALAALLGVDARTIDGAGPVDALARVQRYVFQRGAPQAGSDESVTIFSAPGESREAVEIARAVLRHAGHGVAFDRIAVLLRSPELYRLHLEEAFARAGIPAYFERGTVLPHPSGRAFVALLHCAAERLSARRFGEYLSIGEVPAVAADGAPPPAQTSDERFVRADDDDEARRPDVADDADDADEPAAPAAPSEVRAPWRWERLIVEASVIGGVDRWERRLKGLEAGLRLEDREDGREGRARMLADLVELRGFALPLLADLAALPTSAAWGIWLDRLAALATRALRDPARVLAVLAALQPMAAVGPVTLPEVLHVLAPSLTNLGVRPAGARHGKVFVAPIDAARGLAFDVVFVPGVAEKMFPKKLLEDPLLLDQARRDLGRPLETRDDRLASERLALRLALGAATRQVVLSYPRLDLDAGRPRVPSFYALEVFEAAEGVLSGFDELARRAATRVQSHVGWPAPADPRDAIDEAEHDLGLLQELLRSPADAPTGVGNYLMAANPHLARAIRARARRWTVKAWKPADGFIVSGELGRATLAANGLAARSFSPTALEQFAACPLRFALRAIGRLAPREVPTPIETLGPLERGSLIHEVQFELLGRLRAAGALPLRTADLDDAWRRLDETLATVAQRYHDELCPAIERVWTDAIAAIRGDLREWLRRMALELVWTPWRFELAFGIDAGGGRDPASVAEPVTLDIGLTLRGSIDLVEIDGARALRATDYKTGRASEDARVIDGGRRLQPVLYALALEKLVPGAVVVGGRLDYCTSRGPFQDRVVPLDARARGAATLVVDTVADHVARGFFPAAPAPGACAHCDFRRVCGPHEELRARRKQREPLARLAVLREAP